MRLAMACTAAVTIVILTMGCTNTPIGPSGLVDSTDSVWQEAAHEEAAMELRWDVTASGCDPRRPAPDGLGDPSSTQRISPAVVQAVWDRAGDRTVFAEFHREGATYALCLWDTTGA